MEGSVTELKLVYNSTCTCIQIDLQKFPKDWFPKCMEIVQESFKRWRPTVFHIADPKRSRSWLFGQCSAKKGADLDSIYISISLSIVPSIRPVQLLRDYYITLEIYSDRNIEHSYGTCVFHGLHKQSSINYLVYSITVELTADVHLFLWKKTAESLRNGKTSTI